MSSYMDALADEQLKHMYGAIDKFLNHYKTVGMERGDQQRTVLFFPGGLGSELSQADDSFDPSRTTYQYTQFWLDALQILGGAALQLQMDRDNDVDYDSGRCFIVASGEMDNCLYPAYDGFVDWCDENKLDLLVCGWDNRRNGDWLVSFFLDHFPAYVRQRAAGPPHNINTAINDPLANVYLVGHSEGGMLIKWMLNNHGHPFVRDNVRRAITVATPFYGNVSQCHRMFEGEPEVVGNYSKAALATAIATMPGGYALFLLDSQTYDENRAALAADIYPLLEYPSLDADDFSRVDPYDPRIHEVLDDGRRRYNDFSWDISTYVAEGLEQYKLTAKKLHRDVRDRFHNIRGVQTRDSPDNPGTPEDCPCTPGSLYWKWLWGPFDPDDKEQSSPIIDGQYVAGDGVVPAWSARLVTQDADHVHTVWGDARYFRHMFMMELDGVLAKLLELLQIDEPQRYSQVIMDRREIEPVPAIELAEVSREMSQFANASRPREVRANILRLGENRQKALAKRWYIEMSEGAAYGALEENGSTEVGPAAEDGTLDGQPGPRRG